MKQLSKNLFYILGICFALSTGSSGYSFAAKPVAVVQNANIRIEFNKSLESRVFAQFHNQTYPLGDYSPSETITLANGTVPEFTFSNLSTKPVEDSIGAGKEFIITGKSKNFKKTLTVAVYDSFPTLAVYNVKYTNTSNHPIEISKWTNNAYLVSAVTINKQLTNPPFWTFQDASYESRPDWVLPIRNGFSRQNYLGMNASDYGGGTPVIDLWRQDVGIAIGHFEMVPKLVSLPVEMSSPDHATMAIYYPAKKSVAPGQSLNTFQTFVNVHQGDYFASLKTYRNVMLKKGVSFKKPPESSYEPIWCAWGYGRDFTVDKIINSLDEVKAMGFEWVVLDDGWQIAEGNWTPNPKKFPNGDASMKAFVDSIHAHGLKAKLWWTPLAADPGSKLLKEHPDYLLLNKDGSTQHISWWDSYYLCPADKDVQNYTKALVTKFIKDWGFDGLKIDGQHLNAVPPCYNPAHHHKRPEESVEAVPQFFKVIYNTVLSLNSNAVAELCPCGTGYSFYTMPFINQTVGSDPVSSWQVRLKGKTFKALMGPSAPYYGDHVELSDNGDDFASTVGVGGVIGSKFTTQPDSKEDSTFYLNAQRKVKWKKWVKIYKENMLPKATYLGTLYDIGFGKPEGHAIRKGNVMYYAFYTDHFRGPIELRGLQDKTYKIVDYTNGRDYGTVTGPVGTLHVSFSQHLLLKAVPQ